MDPILDNLTEFASTLAYRDLPDIVVTAARHRMLDALGCAIGAYDCEPAAIGRSLAGPPAPGALAGRIVGSKQLAAADAAGFVRLQMTAKLRERGWDQGFGIGSALLQRSQT